MLNRNLVVALLVFWGSFHYSVAFADAESDALNLESTEDAVKVSDSKATRIFVEGAIGNASQRYGLGSVAMHRASFDLSYSTRIGQGLRFVLSNRLDQIHPRGPGLDETVNSLREAYVSWQPEGARSIVEFGRINLRYGPGYGYNPTDFFRDGSLRAFTTADPFALRENRLGSVMLRGQQLWDGGSLSVAYSPYLERAPSADAWSLDFGSTNNRERLLVALGTQHSPSVSSQLLLYKAQGQSVTIGANVTALLSDAATAHAEISHGREPDLLSQVLLLPPPSASGSRFVGGVTYTTSTKLSLTAEYHYNGFGLTNARWRTLTALPAVKTAYLLESLRLQDLAPRQALLIYLTQKNFLIADLNLTGYIRVNLEDQSRLLWLELRRHWPKFDIAVQLQQNIGGAGSEFGILPDRRVFQVLGSYYF
jgi:hypothetical protein